jgi:CheY-like chemotaxis protein
LDYAVRLLVVEDDQLIQAIVEEALAEGGFQLAITPSGEEAITLLQDDKSQFRAVVTDITLLGKLDESGPRCARNRPEDARHLHDRQPRRGMGVQGRPE